MPLRDLNHVANPFHALHSVKACSPSVVDVRFATATLPSHLAYLAVYLAACREKGLQ